jgi:tetratricopeptide (TPR) repeat protein
MNGIAAATGIAAGLALWLGLCVPPAAAQIRDSDWADCAQDKDQDRLIRGCTAVLERGDRETRRNRAIAYTNRGFAWLKLDQIARAITDFDRAIRADPGFAFAYYNRGGAWARAGALDRAIADYDALLKIDAGFVAAYANRGDLHEKKGDREKAVADYRKALELDPELKVWPERRAHFQKAVADQDAERSRTDAEKALAEQSEKDTRDCDRVDEAERAFAACSAIIAREDREPLKRRAVAFFNRGFISARKDDYDKAIADYDLALTLDPDYVSALAARGFAWRFKGDVDSAIADFTAVLKLEPKNVLALATRGDLFEQKADLAKAVADYRAALELDPDLKVWPQRLDHIKKTVAEFKP